MTVERRSACASHVMLAASLLLPLAGCASRSDDFMVTDRHRQEILLEGATEVVVRCYCPERVWKQHAGIAKLIIDARGSFSSIGYHGAQDRPDSMPAGMQTFDLHKEGPVVVLKSREWTYIHHANLLSRIVVHSPSDVTVRFDPISWNELRNTAQ